jgi:YHS domain-containing protein
MPGGAILPSGRGRVERILPVRFFPRSEEDMMEIDPVCGMEVDPATAEWTYAYEGTTYYFCAKGCLDDFVEAPGDYLG